MDNTKNIDYLRHQMIEKGVDYGPNVKQAEPSTSKNPYVKEVVAVSDHFLLHPNSNKIPELKKIKEFYKSLPKDQQRLAGATFSYVFQRSKEGLQWEIDKLKKEPSERNAELIKRYTEDMKTAQPVEKFFFKQFKLDLKEREKMDKKTTKEDYVAPKSSFYKMKLRADVDDMKEREDRVRDLKLGDTLVMAPKIDKLDEDVEENAAPEQPNYRHTVKGDDYLVSDDKEGAIMNKGLFGEDTCIDHLAIGQTIQIKASSDFSHEPIENHPRGFHRLMYKGIQFGAAPKEAADSALKGAKSNNVLHPGKSSYGITYSFRVPAKLSKMPKGLIWEEYTLTVSPSGKNFQNMDTNWYVTGKPSVLTKEWHPENSVPFLEEGSKIKTEIGTFIVGKPRHYDNKPELKLLNN